MSNFSITHLYPFRRVKITNFGQVSDPNTDNNGFVNFVTVNPDLRFTPICHECGNKAEGIHSWHRRPLHDLPIGNFPSLMFYNYRKIKCPNCGAIKVEQLGVTDVDGEKVTNRMARYVYDLCKKMTVQEVANQVGLDWKTVKNIDKKFLEEDYGETDYEHSGYLAIDEISIGKHHNYMTVVIDFTTGRVIWMGKDRKTETVDKFFDNMPKQQREKVNAVAMDMWDPYIKSIAKWCPQASIVFDKYHIVSNFNDVIDDVRRTEKKAKSDSEKQQNIIKGSRWLLLKNQENLTDKEKPKLEKLLEINKNLSKVYILKDELKEIWNTNNRKEMESALIEWCTKALKTELKPVLKFVEMLLNHNKGILNYAKHQIHNSKLEGINNKIKEIKRSAFGYHDHRYYELKIKQAFPGD
jgi:transposase